MTGVGAMLGLAGCGGGGPAETEATTEEPTATQEATTTGGEAETVPEEYVTATAQGGNQRNPDAVSTKEAVQYQTEPNADQQCSNCTFYIEDKNGDDLGACAIVAGTIDPEGWCVSYAEYQG